QDQTVGESEPPHLLLPRWIRCHQLIADSRVLLFEFRDRVQRSQVEGRTTLGKDLDLILVPLQVERTGRGRLLVELNQKTYCFDILRSVEGYIPILVEELAAVGSHEWIEHPGDTDPVFAAP